MITVFLLKIRAGLITGGHDAHFYAAQLDFSADICLPAGTGARRSSSRCKRSGRESANHEFCEPSLF